LLLLLWALLVCPPSQGGLCYRLLTPSHPSTFSFSSLHHRIFNCVKSDLLVLYLMFFASFFHLCPLPLMLLFLPFNSLIDNRGLCPL
jgi:hypothetical protein